MKNLYNQCWSLIKSFLRKFKQPYPVEESILKKIISVLLISIFVVLFILAFNLDEKENVTSIYIVLGFGIIVGTVLIISRIILPLIFPIYFSQDHWTTLKEICLILLNISAIGLLILFYANVGGYYEITFKTLINSIITSALIGIFPVTFIILIKQNRLLKKYVSKAGELNNYINRNTIITSGDTKRKKIERALYAENGKDHIILNWRNIIFIKSVDNYVEILWLKNGVPQRSLLRNTLKKIYTEFEDKTFLVKCHRSYIININKILNVTGNSQGYKLEVSDFGELIPVSRRYSKMFQEKFLQSA